MDCKIFGSKTTKGAIVVYIKNCNGFIVKILSLMLFCFFPIATFAGSVTSYDDTKISLYGSIKQYFVWGNGNYQEGYPANTAIRKSNLTTFNSYTGTTTLGFDIESDKILANIEGDFEGENNTLILLKAYFAYKLSDSLNLLIGHDMGIGELNTFSDNYYAMPGFDKTRPEGVSQVRLEGSFDLGSVSLAPAIAIENIYPYMFKDEEQEEKNISVKMPGVGAKLALEFPFFQQKARTYAFFETQQVYFNNKDSHWPYIYGIGIQLPIKMVTLQSEFLYGKGSTHYVGLIEAVNKLGMETEVPRGYADSGQARRLRAYNIEASIALSDNWGMYGGFDKVNFMNALSNANIQSADGKFVGLSYNLTKSTTLKLEYDNFKTYYYHHENHELQKATANQLFLSAQYDF
ncbi:hypothetical protein DESAMIL20_1276 [Desulfurella amilsii]|uniref:Porin domain-containing protein n=1 Tax=Desulfurella amilsii TaxID=1562698 RepID=A0A1X4XW09_9BACT|nr:hypothetical protein [Desulfurella amilsii]OSS41723.1 hypothetical protein DESAMIL20_1276 [Desulfurella amilsii]